MEKHNSVPHVIHQQKNDFLSVPFTLYHALVMIRQSRGHKLLPGYRDQPPADEQALAECIPAVAKMD